MNKRILASLLVIGVVGAVAGGSTLALFNDTETSSDNVFAAGALDLEVDWNESYNGENIENQPLTSNPGPIFELNDVKPGDHGEATVSLHLFNNPGFVDMNVTQTANEENGCTEPEAEVDDTCGENAEGELGENLYFTIWMDDGDNILEEGEEVLFNGTAEEMAEQKTFWLDGNPDEAGMQAFENSTTHYVGIKWRVPRSVGNEIQTDSKEFNFTFWAKQARHNEPKDMEPEEEAENLTVYFADLVSGPASHNVTAECVDNEDDCNYSERNYGDDDVEGDLERKMLGTHSNQTGHSVRDQLVFDQSECIIESTDIEVVPASAVGNPDVDAGALVSFNVEDDEECKSGTTVTLASYKGEDNSDVTSQLFDYNTTTVDPTEDEHTLRVDIPEAQ